MFFAKARSNVSVLVIKKEMLDNYKEYLDDLEYNLATAEESLEDEGMPLIDYRTRRSRVRNPLRLFR